MTDAPLVSVVMIFLDAEPFMQAAIESVFGQTYQQWELVLVDDGSRDGSTGIAQRYAETHSSRVRYLEHRGHVNRGMSSSRNAGIRASSGIYVALLDADDVWLPGKLQRQVDLLEMHPDVALVYGTPLCWQTWTGLAGESSQDLLVDTGLRDGTVLPPPTMLIHAYPLGTATPPFPSDFVVRRDVVELVGGFEEHFTGPMQLYEDQAFLTKVYLVAPVLAVNECWTKYRIHPGSCDSKVIGGGQYHEVRQYFLEHFERYLLAHEVMDPFVWRALRSALLPYRHPLLHRVLSLPKTTRLAASSALRTAARRVLPLRVRSALREKWRRHTRR